MPAIPAAIPAQEAGSPLSARALQASFGRVILVAVLVAIGANALLYACKTANPLISADDWYFVGTVVRNAADGHLALGDVFARRSAYDHSQPLNRLVLLFHYRAFNLDFSIEAIVGVLAAFANLGLMWAIVRPATRSRHPAVAACVFAAIAAVYLSLNASVVFDWPLLTLGYIGHGFVLCFLLACWWTLHGVGRLRFALLAIAALAMDLVVSDKGLVATIAATMAIVMVATREGALRRTVPVIGTAWAAYLVYLAAWHWIDAPAAVAGDATRSGLGMLLASLWQRMDGAQAALLAPFSAAIAHPRQLRAMFGGQAGAVAIAIALATIAAHAWFWWRAWGGRRNRAAFVATALMLFFYGLVAGILVVRVSNHALSYLWQPRYAIIYLWNIVALLMMGASQLPAIDETPTGRWSGWPAVLACAAIALLALQLPLSRHTWSGVRYRNANQQRAAVALGALAQRAARDQSSPEMLEHCRVYPQCRSEIAHFLKTHHLNVFSPAFQARNRLYPDARSLPRMRPRRTHGVRGRVKPVGRPDP